MRFPGADSGTLENRPGSYSREKLAGTTNTPLERQSCVRCRVVLLSVSNANFPANFDRVSIVETKLVSRLCLAVFCITIIIKTLAERNILRHAVCTRARRFPRRYRRRVVGGPALNFICEIRRLIPGCTPAGGVCGARAGRSIISGS